MPADFLTSRQKIDYAKSYLYRTYIRDPLNPAQISTLQTLEATVYDTATADPITLRATSFEGGSQSGDITFEKAVLGIAIKELLEKYDPNYIPPFESRIINPDWSACNP